MIDYSKRRLFRQDSVNKQFEIIYDFVDKDHYKVIGNADLYQGEFELTESLCSEKELRFGACESGSIKFKINNGGRKSLIGKKLEVYITLNHDIANKFKLGTYWVDSDKETADRNAREIIAYDSMNKLINKDIAKWYNKWVKDNPNKTIKDIRNAFFSQSWVTKLGVTQASVTLPNDVLVVKNSIQAEQFSSLDFLRALCEINGVFGHINRNNEFTYVSLKDIVEGLYPTETLKPSNTLTPKDSNENDSIGSANYIKVEYESYSCVPIDRISVRKEEGDIGGSYPKDEGTYKNEYIIEDNFFAYGYATTDLNNVCTRLRHNIVGKTYKPCKIDVMGDPTLEVGDEIRVVSEREIFVTYILERSMKGIQALKDNYVSQGVETYGSKANSWQTSIIQLKNKTNILKRTSDQLYSEIYDSETGLSRIKQTADKIEQEVFDRGKADEEWAGKVELTAKNFSVQMKSTETIVDERINPKAQKGDADYNTYYNISYRSVDTPADTPLFNPQNGEYFLNLTTRDLYKYKSSSKTWSTVKTLPLIASSQSSAFNINAEGISAEVKAREDAIGELKLTANDFAVRLKADDKIIDERVNPSAKQGDADYNVYYNISYRGLNTPSFSYVKAPENDQYYLNTTNRRLYKYNGNTKEWVLVKTLPLLAQNLSSAFNMTTEEISAKVSAKGGTNKTFSWSLTVDGFTLYSNSTKVFDVDRAGNLSVTGVVNATKGIFGVGNNRKWTIGSYNYEKDGKQYTGTGIYYNKDTFESKESGVYIGTHGIALGATSTYDDGNTYSAFQVTSSGALHCNNADIKGKITATSGSFTGNVTCKSLTLGEGVTLTDSMFKNNSISGARLTNGSVGTSQISSIKANQVSAGKINNRDVEWQRIEYMTGENQIAVYDNNGTLSTSPSYPSQASVGYLVTSVKTNAIYTLAQANAPA